MPSGQSQIRHLRFCNRILISFGDISSQADNLQTVKYNFYKDKYNRIRNLFLTSKFREELSIDIQLM